MTKKQYRKMPSADYLRAILDYDATSGRLTWRERAPSQFVLNKNTAEQAARSWNSRCAGKPAFTSTANGYCRGSVNNVSYLAHRIIWKMVTGEEPNTEVDHINGLRSDNRWVNLREVSIPENCRNKRLRQTNEASCNGVTRFKRDGRWRARIKDFWGKEVHLGYFDNLDDAVAARKAAEEKLAYHKNHGDRC